MNKKYRNSLALAALVIGNYCPSALGISRIRNQDERFLRNPDFLVPSLPITGRDKVVWLVPKRKNLRYRVGKSRDEATVEPLAIRFDVKRPLGAIAREIALPGRSDELLTLLKEQSTPDPASKVQIPPEAGGIVNFSKLQTLFKRAHHEVTIPAKEITENMSIRNGMFQQLKPFLSMGTRQRIVKKLKGGLPLVLESDLLTPFAARVVRQFTVFRGPNCFHASLAFHGKQLTESPYLNVKREEGYHRSMINFDELWRALNTHFHEVDPRRSRLRYGDLLIFFDVSGEPNQVSYKWIRHAAAYLMGPYTFSKGSKSPNTPYSVKTIDEEWDTWQGYTKNLGVKVFRRNFKTLKKHPPPDQTDWIY